MKVTADEVVTAVNAGENEITLKPGTVYDIGTIAYCKPASINGWGVNCDVSQPVLGLNGYTGSISCHTDDGDSCVLDGRGSHRCVTIYNYDSFSLGYVSLVSLQAITFNNGYAEDGGGGILVQGYAGTTVRLLMCVFQGCRGGKKGGAIKVDVMTQDVHILLLNGNAFYNNTAEEGGDVFVYYDFWVNEVVLAVDNLCPDGSEATAGEELDFGPGETLRRRRVSFISILP